MKKKKTRAFTVTHKILIEKRKKKIEELQRRGEKCVPEEKTVERIVENGKRVANEYGRVQN